MRQTKFPEVIKLPNRDGLNIELQRMIEKEKVYMLKTENVSYMRLCNDKTDGNTVYYQYIDPNGGPMISIGSEIIPGLIVKSITSQLPTRAYNNNIIIEIE